MADKFIDDSGMPVILNALNKKFATKEQIPNFWVGDADAYKEFAEEDNDTLYFIIESSES